MRRLVLLMAVITSTLPYPSDATAQVEAPSAFQRAMDAPPETMDEEFAADAVDAQAEAIESGEPTSGLDPAARQRVEEIVVQARRRAELLEETPVAVTVLSENTLREAGIFQMDQIQNLVPNMAIQTGLDGQSPVIRIRGVGTSTFEAAFDPGVGFYVDGVFIPRAIGQLLDTVDLQQIEVLRGPQGTLFGKNTVGGAVNVTTAKPTPELGGFAMLRPGNYGSLVARAMVNLPIWEDKVLSRFAFSSKSSNGYVDNVFRDTGLSRLGSLAFLGSLRFELIDDVTIDWSGQYADDQNNGRGGRCVFVQPGPLDALVPGFRQACESVSSPFRTSANVAQLNRITSSGTWGVIQYQPGELGPLDDVLIKSVTAWRRQSTRQRVDLDANFFPTGQLSSAGGGAITDGIPGDQEQIQQELQFGGSAWDGRLHFVSGFFAFWENTNNGRTVSVEAGPVSVITLNSINTDNFTWALFGQGTADFTDWLSLTAGIRYTSDRKEFSQDVTDLLTSMPPTRGSAQNTFTSWTPMATLSLLTPEDWLADTSVDHLMGYFTYSRGFKGGGFNAILQPAVDSVDPTPFQPETLDNFELGTKAIAFEGRLTANLALFYGKYDDIQVTQFLTTFDDPNDPTSVTSQRVTRNAAKATTKGVELELVSQPIDDLLITGSLGYVDAKYDDFPDAEDQLNGDIINRAGQTFNRTPDFNSFVSVQYSMAIEIADSSSMNGWLTPRLEWAYRSRYHILEPELVDSVQRGYNLVNARLSYDFFDDRAQVAIWGKNLLDVAYFSEAFGAVSTFGVVTQYYDPPVTFGGELSFRF